MSNNNVGFIKQYLNKYEIIAIYSYGSQVYGTNNEDSDYDYYVVINDNLDRDFNDQFYITYTNNDKKFELNINLINKYHYDKMLEEHAISILECLNTENLLSNTFVENVDINRTILRKSVSEKASNSWVKAKKKIEQGDYYIGIKSLFHSIRILDFGIQLAKNGRIDNFKSVNFIWEDIKDNNYSYEELKEKYQKVYNEYSSEFKKYAPKENNKKFNNK